MFGENVVLLRLMAVKAAVIVVECSCGFRGIVFVIFVTSPVMEGDEVDMSVAVKVGNSCCRQTSALSFAVRGGSPVPGMFVLRKSCGGASSKGILPDLWER